MNLVDERIDETFVSSVRKVRAGVRAGVDSRTFRVIHRLKAIEAPQYSDPWFQNLSESSLEAFVIGRDTRY
jgi:hypothetical protein